jgi:hypothetical protein
VVVRLLSGLALVAALSCFDPSEPEGTLRCTVAGGCPDGFECREDLRCWRSESPRVDAFVPQCANGIDDDCDGKIDGEDPGCRGGDDDDEHGTKKCDDGIDNDGDTYVDFRVPACGGVAMGDPQCDRPDEDNEN